MGSGMSKDGNGKCGHSSCRNRRVQKRVGRISFTYLYCQNREIFCGIRNLRELGLLIQILDACTHVERTYVDDDDFGENRNKSKYTFCENRKRSKHTFCTERKLIS